MERNISNGPGCFSAEFGYSFFCCPHNNRRNIIAFLIKRVRNKGQKGRGEKALDINGEGLRTKSDDSDSSFMSNANIGVEGFKKERVRIVEIDFTATQLKEHPSCVEKLFSPKGVFQRECPIFLVRA